MAEPLAAAVHAVARAGDERADAGVLGGGTMGLMLARLLVLEGRDVTLADRHPERRAQAEALGARAVARARPPRARHGGRRAARVVARGDRGRRARRHGRARRRLPVGQRGDAAVRPAALRRARRPRRVSPHPGRGRPRARAAGRPATSTGARSPARRSASTSCDDALLRPTAGEARKLVVDPRR